MTILYLVGTDPQPDKEQQFNQWYDTIHMPMLFNSKFLDAATRYKLNPIANPAKLASPKYMAILEFKDVNAFNQYRSGGDVKAARLDEHETFNNHPFDKSLLAVYEQLKAWHK